MQIVVGNMLLPVSPAVATMELGYPPTVVVAPAARDRPVSPERPELMGEDPYQTGGHEPIAGDDHACHESDGHTEPKPLMQTGGERYEQDDAQVNAEEPQWYECHHPPMEDVRLAPAGDHQHRVKRRPHRQQGRGRPKQPARPAPPIHQGAVGTAGTLPARQVGVATDNEEGRHDLQYPCRCPQSVDVADQVWHDELPVIAPLGDREDPVPEHDHDDAGHSDQVDRAFS
jgi:hypothetical protein